MGRTRPLMTLDPGWLFLLAGLALFASVVLIPAQRDAHNLAERLDRLRVEEQSAHDRLGAYSEFLSRLEDPDPALLRRLAASQLNLLPKGERSVVVSSSNVDTVTQWIDRSVPQRTYEPTTLPETLLARLATGTFRVWLLSGAVMCMFLGLLLTPTLSRRPGATQSTHSTESDDELTAATTWVDDSLTDSESASDEVPTDNVDERSDADHHIEKVSVNDQILDQADMDVEYALDGQAWFPWSDRELLSGEDTDDTDAGQVDDDAHIAEEKVDQVAAHQRRLPFAKQHAVREIELKPVKVPVKANGICCETSHAANQIDMESPSSDVTSDANGSQEALQECDEDIVVQTQQAEPCDPVDGEQSDEKVDEDALDADADEVTAEAEDEYDDVAVDDEADADDEEGEWEYEDEDEDEEDEEEDDGEYDEDEDEEEDGYEYEYYDEEGNLIDPEDLDDEDWEFVEDDEEEEEK